MNYTINLFSKSTGVCLGSIDIDSRDYVDCLTVKEVKENINNQIYLPEFPDYTDQYTPGNLNDITIDIPDEFWKDWNVLKLSNNV